MYIDSHVHCRDGNERDKETIEHALKVAEDSGLSAIFDMPNTNPPITTRKQVEERLREARKHIDKVFYGLFIGVTSEPEQIREAVETWREFSPKPGEMDGVVGLKMFAGKSVGDLSVVDENKQRLVYRELRKLDYSGVLVVHCEKESLMKPELWNPANPRTHSEARPECSEVQSVADQITFAVIGDYEGHLHIAHVSTSESVDIINEYKNNGMRISCGVTPHHLLLSQSDDILLKVNPPLRSEETRKELFEYFLRGEIDTLESDHAPHTYAQKTGKVLDKDGKPMYMSGIPNLATWPDVLSLLRARGATEELIENVFYKNPSRIFGVDRRENWRKIERGKHVRDYAFDAYADLKWEELWVRD